jgi:copper/silver efflux system protein
MVSSTILTLIVIPAVYGLIKGWKLSQSGAAVEAAAASVS